MLARKRNELINLLKVKEDDKVKLDIIDDLFLDIITEFIEHNLPAGDQIEMEAVIDGMMKEKKADMKDIEKVFVSCLSKIPHMENRLDAYADHRVCIFVKSLLTEKRRKDGRH